MVEFPGLNFVVVEPWTRNLILLPVILLKPLRVSDGPFSSSYLGCFLTCGEKDK